MLGRKGHSSEEELDDDEDPVEDMKVEVLRTPLIEFSGHSGVVVCADFVSPSYDQIITASWDRQAILWDIESHQALQTLSGHDHELTHVSSHPTQRLVVTASRDTSFRLWDFRDQICSVSVFQGHSE
jgi:WD40 repeat protein